MYNDIKTKQFNIKEVFNASFQIYKRKFKLIITYVTIISAITLTVAPIIFTLFSFLDVNISYFWVSMLVYLIVTYIATTKYLALTQLTNAVLEDGEFTFKELLKSYKKVIQFTITLISHTLALVLIATPIIFLFEIYMENQFILTLAIASFLISVLLYFSIMFIFHLNIVSHRGIWGIKPLLESCRLIRGQWLKTFLILFICVVVSIMFMEISHFIFLMLGIGAIGAVLSHFLFAYITAYAVLTISIWYFNRHYSYYSNSTNKDLMYNDNFQ